MSSKSKKEKPQISKEEKTRLIVMAALLASLTILCTTFLRLPIASGYIHLGTVIVFLTIPIMGVKYGTFIAAISTALADLISGFALWAPASFVIMLVGTFIFGFCLSRTYKSKGYLPLAPTTMEFVGAVLAIIIIIFGYYIYGALVVYGSWAGALAEIPLDVVQVLGCMILAKIMGIALCKTNFRSYFAYPFGTTSNNKENEV